MRCLKNGLNPVIKSDRGFSLLEVVMALTIFSVFIVAFMTSQGFNITTSTQLNEDIIMHTLAERMMNEEILNPPQFTKTLDKEVKTAAFEEEDYKEYTYTIEYKRLELPELSQIQGQEEGEESSGQNATKMIFKKLKKNMEEMIWQVRITITNTNNDYKYELTTWVENTKAKLDLNFAL
jgi:type II secretion system protein I